MCYQPMRIRDSNRFPTQNDGVRGFRAFTANARPATVPRKGKGGDMIMPVILWTLLAVPGCAAFAALGIWASITDEGYRAQRRRALEMQPILVVSARAEETRVMTLGGEEGEVTLAGLGQS